MKQLRLCGLCRTWNSEPCGEQCGLSLTDPTWNAAFLLSPSITEPLGKTLFDCDSVHGLKNDETRKRIWQTVLNQEKRNGYNEQAEKFASFVIHKRREKHSISGGVAEALKRARDLYGDLREILNECFTVVSNESENLQESTDTRHELRNLAVKIVEVLAKIDGKPEDTHEREEREYNESLAHECPRCTRRLRIEGAGFKCDNCGGQFPSLNFKFTGPSERLSGGSNPPGSTVSSDWPDVYSVCEHCRRPFFNAVEACVHCGTPNPEIKKHDI